MKIKNVTHHILSDYHGGNLADVVTDPYEMREKRPDVFNDFVAFTCLLNHPDEYLYCGLTRFNGDVFYRFNVQTKQFECLDYQPLSEIFECKAHPSVIGGRFPS